MGSLDESRRKVFEFIDESTEEFLEFLGDYIRIKSVNPRIAVETSDGPAEVKTCQEWLYNTLDSWNIFSKLDKWEVEPGQPNIAAILSGTAKGDGESLMFNGHSDTVDVTAEQLKSWTGPGPWSGIVKDGRVWGRGAGDMKAG
ncbi:MAG: M20/M25/M40 family metallo-hydrolase, partial [Firmicutes bacterium]|nr:M20/M25/M40 family metallo-hydrolase [Bacillota bacterium]